MAGALTAALRWGVFGLLTSGLIGRIGWAVIGAVCGELFAYYREQPLSGTKLRGIGEGMEPDSSAIVVFMKSADEALLSATAAYEPTTASLAACDRGGFLGGGLMTGVIWGAFGMLAGALYGLFVGNVLSARQLKS